MQIIIIRALSKHELRHIKMFKMTDGAFKLKLIAVNILCGYFNESRWICVTWFLVVVLFVFNLLRNERRVLKITPGVTTGFIFINF